MSRSLANLVVASCLVIGACDEPIYSDVSNPASGAVEVGDRAKDAGDTALDASRHEGSTASMLDAGDEVDEVDEVDDVDGGDGADSNDAGGDAATGPVPQADAGPDSAVPKPAPAIPACETAAAAVVGSGAALAFGDFDDDGEIDFVLGDPSADELRGAVCFYSGLHRKDAGSLGPCVRWTQASDVTSGAPEAGDRCGAALAVGDFDGDGVDDVAIGCPGEGFRDFEAEAGQLTVVFGKATIGPDFERVQVFTQTMMGRNAEAFDHFAVALAAADFNTDGIADLAMGAPNESVTVEGALIVDTGVVNFMSGKAGVGLDLATYVGIGQGDSFNMFHVPGLIAGRDDTYEKGDLFGSALSVASLRFNGVLRPTLLIGVPGEDDGKGVVQLLAGGTPSGLNAPTASAVLSASGAAGAGFGGALTAMGASRVFVGAPYAHDAAGAVWSFKIAADNWSAPELTELRKAPVLEEGPRRNDLFGYSLAASKSALFVGVPGEDLPQSATCDEGSVERFDEALGDALVDGPAFTRAGRSGTGVAVSSFVTANGAAMLGIAHTSQATPDLYSDVE